METTKYKILFVLVAMSINLMAQDKNKGETFQDNDNYTYTPLVNKKSEKEQELQKPTTAPTKNQLNSLPQFPGGKVALQNYIRRNLNKSIVEAESEGGLVSLSFNVNYNGQISNIKILNSLDYACDKEAVRLVQSMPQWTPGMENGSYVTMDYSVSIVFSSKDQPEENADTQTYVEAGRANSGIETPTKMDAVPTSKIDTTTSAELMTTSIVVGEPVVIVNQKSCAPEFPGGEDNLWEFIDNNMDEKLADDSGSVTISFVINNDGTISQPRIVKGLSYMHDREALRLIKLMPPWTPAMKNGTKEASEFQLIIPF